MNYRPPLLLRNGHINTIYPVLFRRQASLPYERERLATEDDDFFDVDFLKSNNSRIAIVCHGLEGSSSSKYVIGTAGILAKRGWDVAAVNHRSCSGEINNTSRMYHSGATWDLGFLVDLLSERYDEICLVGFSLGGNMVLKYTGEKGSELNDRIKSVVAVSVPMDLRAGSLHIGRLSNYIYEKKFLITLLQKMRIKAEQFPELVDSEKIKSCKSMYAFDDFFTAPLHGFRDADDYYAQSSSKFFVESIERPCLIINALDDPFLPDECYPVEIVSRNDCVSLEMPEYGGHVGFVNPGSEFYWEEERICNFVDSHSGMAPQSMN